MKYLFLLTGVIVLGVAGFFVFNAKLATVENITPLISPPAPEETLQETPPAPVQKVSPPAPKTSSGPVYKDFKEFSWTQISAQKPAQKDVELDAYTTQSDCEAHNGAWVTMGVFVPENPKCYQKTPDDGKECQNSSMCSGTCGLVSKYQLTKDPKDIMLYRADAGLCSTFFSDGCGHHFENGKIFQNPICAQI